MLPASRLDSASHHPTHFDFTLLFPLGPLAGLWGIALWPGFPAPSWVAGLLAATILFLGHEVLEEGLFASFHELRLKNDALSAAAAIMGFSMGFLLSALELAGRAGSFERPGAAAIFFYFASATIIGCRLLQRKLLAPEIRWPGWKDFKDEEEDRQVRQVCRAYAAMVLLCLAAACCLGRGVWGLTPRESFLLLMSALVALLAASSPGMILLARRVHAARARQSFERFRLRGDPPLAQISDVKVLFFERSGVLTEGRPQVTAVHALEDGWCAEDVLHFAAIAEFKAQHPIREAILRRYQAHSRTVPDVKGFQARPSRGVRAVYQGKELLFGNLRLYRDAGWPEERLQFLEGKCREWSSSGETVLFAALGGEVRGAVCLLDPPRREAEAAIEKLHQLGVRTCLLSGDSPASVEALSKSFAGLEIHAGLLPEEKARRIEGERREGNGLALATLSRESHRIDLQIGRHRLLENELLDVPAALAEARALLGEEKRSLLFLSLYHAVTLPLIASACSLSATSGSLPALAAVLVLAAAAGAFVPPFLLRPRRRSTALPALPVPAPEAGDRQRAREPVGGSV